MTTSFSEAVRKRRPGSETCRESRNQNRKSDKVANSGGERRIAEQWRTVAANVSGKRRRWRLWKLLSVRKSVSDLPAARRVVSPGFGIVKARRSRTAAANGVSLGSGKWRWWMAVANGDGEWRRQMAAAKGDGRWRRWLAMFFFLISLHMRCCCCCCWCCSGNYLDIDYSSRYDLQRTIDSEKQYW